MFLFFHSFQNERHVKNECIAVEPRFSCVNCGSRFRRKIYLKDHNCPVGDIHFKYLSLSSIGFLHFTFLLPLCATVYCSTICLSCFIFFSLWNTKIWLMSRDSRPVVSLLPDIFSPEFLASPDVLYNFLLHSSLLCVYTWLHLYDLTWIGKSY